MKFKRIKHENIFLLFIIYQFICWLSNNALNEYCIIYYVFIFIIYKAIKYIRRYKED